MKRGLWREVVEEDFFVGQFESAVFAVVRHHGEDPADQGDLGFFGDGPGMVMSDRLQSQMDVEKAEEEKEGQGGEWTKPWGEKEGDQGQCRQQGLNGYIRSERDRLHLFLVGLVIDHVNIVKD